VKDRFLGQDLPQALFEGFQRLVLLLACALNRCFTDGISEHFGTHLADAQTGSLLGVVEITEQTAEVLSILDRGVDRVGKGGGA
jgi:hypothetical protein